MVAIFLQGDLTDCAFVSSVACTRRDTAQKRHSPGERQPVRWSSGRRGSTSPLKSQSGQPMTALGPYTSRAVMVVSADGELCELEWPNQTGGSVTTTLVADETVATQIRDQSGSKLRVLLVEDELADAELILRALRQAGFEVIEDIAQTAKAFTELVRKNSYDVILADYKLPNWNGMESVELLRREQTGHSGHPGIGSPGGTNGGRMHQRGRRRLCPEGPTGAASRFGAAGHARERTTAGEQTRA